MYKHNLYDLQISFDYQRYSHSIFCSRINTFLKLLKKKYNPDKIIHIGDELDKHAMSFHDSDPDLPSAGDELKMSLPMIKELEKLFPQMDLMDSNHGSLVYRRALKHGIPKAYLKTIMNFYKLEKIGNGMTI